MLPIRILLVDDNPQFLKSASGYLQKRTAFQLVGQATSGAEAIRRVWELTPDLVLIDWGMPGLSGLEVTRLLKAQSQSPQVVILGMNDAPHYSAAAFLAGADGFIVKDDWSRQLMALVQKWFPEALVQYSLIYSTTIRKHSIGKETSD